MPELPLPSTAQFTAVIDAIEPTILRPLALPIAWLRDRLDPLHIAEELEEQRIEREKIRSSEEKIKRRREAKRGAKGVGVAADQYNNQTTKKKSTAVEQEKNKQNMERRQSHRLDDKSLMDHTYHHEKLNLPAGQQPFHTKDEKDGRDHKKQEQNRKTLEIQKLMVEKEQEGHAKSEEDHDPQYTQRASRDKRVDSIPRQPRQQKLEHPPEESRSKGIFAAEDHERPVEIREEEARVTKELQEAMNTKIFKQWPIERETDPKIQSSKKVQESTEYRAPLSNEDKARKQELLKQWMKIEEKDSQPRVAVMNKADYEEDQIMDMLMSTSMFKPTLEPYVETGKNIPTRKEVLADYGSGTSIYEDAIGYLPTTSNSKNGRSTSRISEKETASSKYTRTPRTRRTMITDIDEDEEPAFAPRK